MPLPQDDVAGATNPLFNQTPNASWPELAKRVVVGILLLPLRLFFTIVNAILALALAKIATCGIQRSHHDPLTIAPLETWRLRVLAPLALLSRWQLFLMGFIRIRIRGQCAPKSEAPILVANHVSGLVEGIFLWRYCKLAEASYLANPVLGPLMLATQGILVDRNDPNSRETAKSALLQRADDDRFPHTIVFPEGTCTNGSALVQFKQGAFVPCVPVQPIVFRYPYIHHDPSFTHPHTNVSYLLGLFLQFVNHMEVEYLPIYIPGAEEAKNPVLFAAGVQQTMAAALGVPTTKHAAEDVALCMQAMSLSLPAEVGVIKWQAISEQLTGVTVKDAKDALTRFRSLDEEADGVLDFEAFKAAMLRKEAKLTDDELRAIFNLMDLSGDGLVNFTEYFCGVAVLNGHGVQEKTASLKWVFDCLAQGQSHFTKAQLDVLLCRVSPTLPRERLDELFKEADRDGKGVVSRDDFIVFANNHREDLNWSASSMLGGLPIPELTGKKRAPSRT